LVRDLKEARDIAATTGDIADLKRDLLARGVFCEVHQGKPTSGEELNDAVGADAFTCFKLDHDRDL
jgi:hypothetical protein